MNIIIIILPGSTLEEILAAARNQPDELDLVEDVDSDDETSSDADEEVIVSHHSSRKSSHHSSRKSSHLSQHLEANEHFDQSAGVVECEEVDSSNESSSDADDDGFTFVKKDEENIISAFPRSNSPLVIDTVATENEYLQPEVEDDGLEKPEIILKSALLNPNVNEENLINDQDDDIISQQIEAVNAAQKKYSTEVIDHLNSANEIFGQESIEVHEVSEKSDPTDEISENFEVVANQDYDIALERKNSDIILGEKKVSITYGEENLAAVEHSEESFVTDKPASPLLVAPAVNTLNALEDYMNQDIAYAESSSSAPSSLESQSGPASVIIESQEVPIPDQASFIIKPTESHQIELPSPQEAVVEVLPEEHFRERSQSPILEENEDMSDSESKSPLPVSNHNGNGLDVLEDDDTPSRKVSNEAFEVNRSSVGIDEVITVSKEIELSATTPNDLIMDKLEENDEASEEIKSEIDVNRYSDITEDETKEINEQVVDQETFIKAEESLEVNEIKVESELLEPKETIVSNTEITMDESSTLASALPIDDQKDCEALIEKEDASLDGVTFDQKYDEKETHEEAKEIIIDASSIDVVENEKVETVTKEETSPAANIMETIEDIVEPATAEVQEGNIGFYTKKDSQAEIPKCELNQENLVESEMPKEDAVIEPEAIKKTSIQELVLEVEIPEKAIKHLTGNEAESFVDQPINTECSFEENQTNLQSDNDKETDVLAAPIVNLTPATPVPEVIDDAIEVTLQREDKNETEEMIPVTIVTEPPVEEIKETKKPEEKKVVEEKRTASPALKRGTKPAPVKTTGVTSKPAGASATPLKPKTKAPAPKPIASTTSRTTTRPPVSGSTSPIKRPASGATAAKSTNGVTKSAAPAKPTTRPTTTTRPTPATPSRVTPISSRPAPITKPKTPAGASTNAVGARTPASTTRTVTTRTPATKPKVDEIKKTTTSTVSARSTLTRTASPAGASRSKTPSSPKTTAPKPTRTVTSTTASRAPISSTATSRASTKPTTPTSTISAARKAPTPKPTTVKSSTTAAAPRTTTTRTTTPSTRSTLSSTSPAKSRAVGTDIMRRPLVPSGPRPTDLTKKRIPSAKDKSISTKTTHKKTGEKVVDSSPDGSGQEKSLTSSPIKVSGGSSPDEASKLSNGATNGDDGNVSSGQIPGTPVDSSGAASPVTGEPGLQSLTNGSL